MQFQRQDSRVDIAVVGIVGIEALVTQNVAAARAPMLAIQVSEVGSDRIGEERRVARRNLPKVPLALAAER